jgi:hypothetical protein
MWCKRQAASSELRPDPWMVTLVSTMPQNWRAVSLLDTVSESMHWNWGAVIYVDMISESVPHNWSAVIHIDTVFERMPQSWIVLIHQDTVLECMPQNWRALIHLDTVLECMPQYLILVIHVDMVLGSVPQNWALSGFETCSLRWHCLKELVSKMAILGPNLWRFPSFFMVHPVELCSYRTDVTMTSTNNQIIIYLTTRVILFQNQQKSWSQTVCIFPPKIKNCFFWLCK